MTQLIQTQPLTDWVAENCPIQPHDLAFNEHHDIRYKHLTGFSEADGAHFATDVSATTLLLFFQKLGEWKQFTVDEVRKFAQSVGRHEFYLNRLAGGPFKTGFCKNRVEHPRMDFVIKSKDGKCRITPKFIYRCNFLCNSFGHRPQPNRLVF